MELDNINSVQDEQQFRASASPFLMSSRAPVASPQSWELHDVDFLLSGPIASTSRSCFQGSPRRHYSGLHESDIAFSTEQDDTTKSLAFRSGTYWQDMALNEPSTNEFSSYLADDIFSDKVVSVSRSPSSKLSRGKFVPPTTLRVNASACTDGEFAENPRSRNNANTLKNEASVVSPTMVDKKVLVTDNDLRLFSASNMKTLREKKKTKTSPHHPKKTKKVSPVMATSTAPTRNKRRASLEPDIDDQAIRALKRTKSLDQQAWVAPNFDPRWYLGRTEGYHGIQLRFLSPINSSTSLDYGGAYSRVQHQVRVQQLQNQSKLLHSQYSPPTRKIGIYSPAERRERLKRFHEKRKLRVYHKRIKYDCRKRLANSCPRIKGRFVRKSEYLQTKSDIASPCTSESTSSTEE